jgi:hypothetical protein
MVANHQYYRYPHYLLLGLDPDFVGLHLHQVTFLQHEVEMLGL